MINKSIYNLSFIVRPSKVNKVGKAPIEVLITLGDERVVFSTGKLVALGSWNKDKQCVRGVNPEAVSLNEYLKNMRVRIYDEELKLVKHGFAVTATLLRDALLNKVELIKEETILGIYRKHNELQFKQIGMGVSKGTYANSKHGLNLLEKFINDTYNRDDVFLRELNRDFIEEFPIWLLTEHHLSHNGAVKYLALLKKVVNRAVANNKMSFNPFATYRLERQTVSPDFLTEEELRKIINFNSPLPRLEQTRDMFLFACYTGLSYIDVKTLKPEHLERDKQGRMWIKKHRVKTGVLSRIPLLPSAKMLLDKYAGNETLMPIFSPKDINLFLKDIAILCNIDKRITFHTARKTFGRQVYNMNSDNSELALIKLMELFNHSSVAITKRYLGLRQEEILETYDTLSF